MNYDIIYCRLISRAKTQNRKKLKKTDPNYVYYERHHIIPKCIQSEFSDLKKHPWNGVLLTPEEHYLSHLLLVKMNFYKKHSNYNGLICGAHKMCCSSSLQERNNKTYGWLKRHISEIRRDPIKDANRRMKISLKNTGKTHSNKGKSWEELMGVEKSSLRKKNLSDKTKGRKSSSITCKNISKGKTGKKIKPCSDSRKIKIGNSNRGKKRSEEAKKQQSDRMKGKTYEDVYGKEKADEIKKNLSNSLKGKIKSSEHIKNLIKAKTGVPSGRKGVKLTEEHKTNIKAAWALKKNKSGKSQEKVICPHCLVIGGKPVMGRWHFNNCKLKT
jgi:hypothetical protein